MQDNLKALVDSKRETFESYKLDEGQSWTPIANRLDKDKKPKGLIIYWKYAVAACLILATGLVAFNFGQHQNEYYASAEFAEVEGYYQQEIQAKLVLVKTKMNDPQLIADLASIDQSFADLKSDLRDNVDNAEVVEAMMDNYRLKLRILERILEKIDEDENNEDESKIHL